MSIYHYHPSSTSPSPLPYCPPYPPYPSSYQLDRSLIQLQLRKPSFLIHQEHDEPLPMQSLPQQNYHLSQQSSLRLERIDRNPFYKHSQVQRRYEAPEEPSPRRNDDFEVPPQIPTQQDYNAEYYRDIFTALVQHHPRPEPQSTPEPQPKPIPAPEIVTSQENQKQKEERIEQILTEVARMHCRENNLGKESKTKLQSTPYPANEITYQPLNNGLQQVGNYLNYHTQDPYKEESVAPPESTDHEKRRPSEDEWRGNPVFRQTPTIIQELGEEQLGHKLVRSEVEEFPNEDPMTYWARKPSGAPGGSVGGGSLPRSICVRGITYEMVPV